MTNVFKRFLPLFLLGIWLFSGCGNDSDEPVLSSEKELSAFRLPAELNPDVLRADVEGTIEGNDIRLTLPEGTDCSSLIASFTYRGAGVYIGDALQQSGVTANDFSGEPPVYRVVAEDKSIRQYRVQLTFEADPDLVMHAFSFKKAQNPGLNSDCDLSISDRRIYGGVTASTSRLIAVFETDAAEVTVGGVRQVSGETENDFSQPVTYVLTSASGNRAAFTVSVTWESAIPHIYIDTENNRPIVEKDLYLNATVRIDGKGLYSDFEATTQIKGRGNSTWGMPKKPYRLKLNEKASLLGLGKAKNWVLLANYIDPILMLNAVAMKTGQLLELPFTNHIIPVDVTLNGRYIGNYMFTEKIETGKNRVNIDESTGVLLELDTNYDEDWKFHSSHYNLPVMVKDPDMESQAQFDGFKQAFQRLEDLMAAADFPNNAYLDHIDAESVVAYLIVYNLTHNMEINHPKSTYMYKEGDGKWFMGPIWDFDWAYGYEGTSTHFSSYTRPVLSGSIGNGTGYNFFSRFLLDPKIQQLYRDKWQQFHTQHLDELLAYIDAYAASIRESQRMNYQLWGGASDFDRKVNELKSWLKGRAEYIDEYVRHF